MTDPAQRAVTEHYRAPELAERILAAVERSGQPISVEMLAAVDEFHTAGRRATERLAGQLAVTADSEVLDVGSGIGGTARFLAAGYGCRVTGIDLTADYVRTARVLTERVGMTELVRFEQGSALRMPFAANSFDVICLIHVGMNIADKDALCGELARVLRPGGRCGVFDIIRTAAGELGYPTPWASGRQDDHLGELDDYLNGLRAAGLQVTASRNWQRDPPEPLPQQPPGVLGPHLLMDDLAARQANVRAAMHQGLLAPVEIICER